MADPTLNAVQRQIFNASQAVQSYVCVNTSTASGVPGRDQLNPITSGHATITRWDVDESLASSRLSGTASARPGSMTDNVLHDGGGSDVVTDDPRDWPDPNHYPFSYCSPVAPGGLAAMRDVAEQFGDYQFASHNCVDFATTAFEAATQQCVLGTPREGLLDIGSPRELGRRINELNGFPSSGDVSRSPFSIAHDREGGLLLPGQIRSGGESYGIVGSNGDRLGLEVEGPDVQYGHGGFDVSAGSASIGLDAQTSSGSFGFDAGVGLGVSGGLYTGDDGRFGVDVPFLGGLVFEHGDSGYSVETQVGPFDVDLHVDQGIVDSVTDSVSGAWDSFTELF